MIQCTFKKENRITTAWVDKKPKLKVGAICELKDKEVGDREVGDREGWRVVLIGIELNAEYVKNQERNYLYQREALDI